jgi:hypothetical protein
MRQTRIRPIRNTMVALGAVLLVLTAATVAAAAKPTAPDVKWNVLTEGDVVCSSESSNLTVRASVDTEAELSHFDISVRRFETVLVTSPDILDGPDVVERWHAGFWNNGRKGPTVPKEWTLDTGKSETWSSHSYMVNDDVQYVDDLDLFVVHLNAGVRGSGNTPGESDWADWAVNCSGGTPDVTAYRAPWDTLWNEVRRDLNP